MMPIKKLKAKITAVRDLSQTAREITLTLSEPLEFIAGSFVNLFIEHDGEVLRRAYSISSVDGKAKNITLSIRLKPTGAMTPLFWNNDIIGTEVDLMGPLGLNTADKMLNDKVYLFGFGVGAGVVKSLAEHFVKRTDLSSLTIITGNRSADEILHKNFFDNFATKHPKVKVDYVVSKKGADGQYKTGYIQDHISDFDFNNSNVYVCGQEVACEALVDTVKKLDPKDCTYMVEGFH